MKNVMKQLVILSGKGGTGKTCVTAALAHLAAEDKRPVSVVLADADVDAANLELLIKPRIRQREDFRGGQIAIINHETCDGCGECAAVCRFDAVHEKNGVYQVDPIACDGCAACVYQCPMKPLGCMSKWLGSGSVPRAATDRYSTPPCARLRITLENWSRWSSSTPGCLPWMRGTN